MKKQYYIWLALVIVTMASCFFHINLEAEECHHEWNTNGTIAPTTKKTGLRVRTCTLCKKLEKSVIPKIPKVHLNYEEVFLQKRFCEDEILKVIGTKQKVKWSSSNPKLVKVNSKGKITLQKNKNGKAIITAKVGKKKYKCTVHSLVYLKKPELVTPFNIFEGGEEPLYGPAKFEIHGCGEYYYRKDRYINGNSLHGWYYHKTTKTKFESRYVVVGDKLYVGTAGVNKKNYRGCSIYKIVYTDPVTVKLQSLNDTYYDMGATYILEMNPYSDARKKLKLSAIENMPLVFINGVYLFGDIKLEIGNDDHSPNHLNAWYYNSKTQTECECSLHQNESRLVLEHISNKNHEKNIKGNPEFIILENTYDKIVIQSVSNNYGDYGQKYELKKRR